MDFIDYLKSLEEEDWQKMVTDKWTVKDVVAHLVGWEKVAFNVLERYSKMGEDEPWMVKTDEYDRFNAGSVEKYKSYTPAELIVEWGRWQKGIDDLIEKIGEEKLRANKKMLWVFDEGESSHYGHHFGEIQKALGGGWFRVRVWERARVRGGHPGRCCQRGRVFAMQKPGVRLSCGSGALSLSAAVPLKREPSRPKCTLPGHFCHGKYSAQ